MRRGAEPTSDDSPPADDLPPDVRRRVGARRRRAASRRAEWLMRFRPEIAVESQALIARWEPA